MCLPSRGCSGTGRPAAQPASSSARSASSSSTASSASATPAHHRQSAARRSACGTALWRHVYHPDRLRLVRRCMTVRGRVTELRWEPDGDLHILLATRPGLVNADNDRYEHGDLVLEEICQGSVTQADAVAACRGVPHDLTVPSVGERVSVSGPYVLDADHGWMEIHPVTNLTITGSAPRSSPSSAPPVQVCSPIQKPGKENPDTYIIPGKQGLQARCPVIGMSGRISSLRMRSWRSALPFLAASLWGSVVAAKRAGMGL